MSHSTVLVVGFDVEKQLEPFNEHLEVEPYPRPEKDKSLMSMLKHYAEEGTAQEKVLAPQISFELNPADQLPALKKLYEDWSGHELLILDAPVDGCRYGYLSPYNPRSRWDWYQIGG